MVCIWLMVPVQGDTKELRFIIIYGWKYFKLYLYCTKFGEMDAPHLGIQKHILHKIGCD